MAQKKTKPLEVSYTGYSGVENKIIDVESTEYNSKNNISIKITDKEDNLFAEDVKTCNYQIHREMAPIYTLGNKPFERKQTIRPVQFIEPELNVNDYDPRSNNYNPNWRNEEENNG